MIRAENVCKYYGDKRALGPVSFEISDGETVGFLGLNGAGKTTALRIFACDLRPSQGSVVVGDIDAVKNPHEVRKRIGYLPEHLPLYQDMVVDEYLAYAGRLRQMSKSSIAKRMPEVLEATDLTEVRGEIISTLSHGYRQRVGVGQAIMHDPMLLILDEPTRGLDPVQIVEMRNMIQNLKDNHTVLVSSHILTEISETCDRLLVLGDGAVLASGSEAELATKMRSTSRTVVTVKGAEGSSDKDIAKALREIESVSDVKIGGSEEGATLFEIISGGEIRAEVCRVMVSGGHDVLQLARNHRELESIFLKLVRNEGATSASN
ncbi:MAG: ABC transporter ATP-binding protein [Myxococcales bacterium]|nr:ABC transporter ATP-binding protein [Myxococcales bacterium]